MHSAIKSFLLLAFFSFILIVSAPTLHAETRIDGATPVNSSNFGAFQNTNFAEENLVGTTYCILTGPGNVPGEKCTVNAYQPNDPNEGAGVYLFNKPIPGGGALGSLGNATMALYTPPTSSAEYVAYLGRNLGLADEVYAQVPGTGSSLISPIFAIWEVVRNLTYVLFILVFIVVGFMIMFRQKLNPQTVISVQTALPGLIIGLILVTFSYFIAALIADVAFYGVPLVSEIFIQTDAPNAVIGGSNKVERDTNYKNAANNSNIFGLFPVFRLQGTTVSNTGTIISTITQIINASTSTTGSTGVNWFTGPLAAIGALLPFTLGIGAGAGVIAGGLVVVSLILPLILIIALFIQMFRLLLKLLTAYITILVMTILGPIIILSASLPGKGGSLSTWWKTILANALVFPAVFGAILFAGYILGSVGDTNLWTQPPPLFGGLTPGIIPLLVAYGILLGTPAVPDMVKSAFGVKDQNGIMGAAMGGFMAGFGVGKKGYDKYTESGQAEQKAYKDLRARNKVAPPGTTALNKPSFGRGRFY